MSEILHLFTQVEINQRVLTAQFTHWNYKSHPFPPCQWVFSPASRVWQWHVVWSLRRFLCPQIQPPPVPLQMLPRHDHLLPAEFGCSLQNLLKHLLRTLQVLRRRAVAQSSQWQLLKTKTIHIENHPFLFLFFLILFGFIVFFTFCSHPHWFHKKGIKFFYALVSPEKWWVWTGNFPFSDAKTEVYS